MTERVTKEMEIPLDDRIPLEYNKGRVCFCSVMQASLRRPTEWKLDSYRCVSMRGEVTRHLPKGQEVLYEPTPVPTVARCPLAYSPSLPAPGGSRERQALRHLRATRFFKQLIRTRLPVAFHPGPAARARRCGSLADRRAQKWLFGIAEG